MFIKFYDEFVDDTLTLDLRDVEEMTLIDGKIIIFNVDGLSYQTVHIEFLGKEG